MSTLHGISISPYVRKVRIALGEKGIHAYDHNQVVHFDLPDGFEKLHPLRKIPVWTTDEGEHIPDSSVIIAYLDALHPTPRLIPEDPVLMARALFLEEFADSALSMAIATVFLERFAAPMFFGRDSNEDLIKKMLDETLPSLFAHLDETLGNRDFLVGDCFTVADAAVASPLVNLRHTGNEIDGRKYPNLRRYADALIVRPSIAKLLAEEVAAYGGNSPEAKAAQS